MRRLIDLTVTPDRAPPVRITTPGRDLFLPNGRRSIDVKRSRPTTTSRCDSLRLTYTKVTGAGENFTFSDGEVALEIASTHPQVDRKGRFRLESLALEAGDMVIYRGIATDHRPGAAPVESDTFIIEIVSPGALASEGFAIDDRDNQYALSQQMVIVKTERLIAKKSDAHGRRLQRRVARPRGGTAAGARGVRLHDGRRARRCGPRHDHAERGGGGGRRGRSRAGRMANQGRIDLLRAIRAMSHAATPLGEVNLARRSSRRKSRSPFCSARFRGAATSCAPSVSASGSICHDGSPACLPRSRVDLARSPSPRHHRASWRSAARSRRSPNWPRCRRLRAAASPPGAPLRSHRKFCVSIPPRPHFATSRRC